MKTYLPTELLFEPALGLELQDKISAVAMEYLRPLFIKDYEKILGQLAKNPTQRNAMTMECGHFQLEGYPELIFLLRAVTYDHGIAQCLAFFGRKNAIHRQLASVSAQLKQGPRRCGRRGNGAGTMGS